MSERSNGSSAGGQGAPNDWLVQALELGGIGVWEWEPSDDRVTLHGDQERLLGLDQGRFGGTLASLLACICSDDRDGVREMLMHCARDGRDYEGELCVELPSGERRWLHTRARLVAGAEGRSPRVVATSHDVSGFRQANDALEQSTGLIHLAVEAARLGVWIADLRTNAVRHTHYGGFLAGLADHQIPHDLESFMAMVHPEDRTKVGRELERATEEETRYRVEFRVVRPDGEIRWVHARGEVLRDSSGQPVSLSGVDMDVTERIEADHARRQLEARVQHAQRLESLGVLAGGMAHDFNNLLVGILGNADLALLDLPAHSTIRGRIEDIQAAGIRASELTKQMLAYSGRGKFVIEVLDLNTLISGMSQLLRVAISKTCTLRYDLQEDLPPIEADVAQLQQVVMNLITNASEAIGENHGMISLSTGVVDADARYLADVNGAEDLSEGRYVYLEVSDNGRGMDEATIGRIFDPFFTTKFTGRGLGLAGVLGIVRGHGAALRVYSEPGRGTTFKVLFPCSDASWPPHQQPIAPPPDVWRGRGAMLIVDDEVSVRSVIKSALERAGFTVFTATNGREGLQQLELHGAELVLVLLDMTMPELDGEGTFREIRRRRPELPVVLMSGYNEQEATTRFVGKGLAGFLQKPFRATDLIATIRAALGDPRPTES